MTPTPVAAHPLVRENTASVAIERGPLVYCLEQHDQPEGVAVAQARFRLTSDPARDFVPEERADLLGGVVLLRHQGLRVPEPLSAIPLYRPLAAAETQFQPAALTLIPYYAFLNRGPAAMQVWVPYVRQ
jgi:DUF1680 family protein